MNHDQLFKLLITAYFWEFVELFVPDMLPYLDRHSLAFEDKEAFAELLGGEKFEADIVARVRFRKRNAFFLVHVEVQSSARAGFARRMFRYFSVLHGRYGLPVYPIAVLSYDRPKRTEPDRYTVAFEDLPVLDFRYRTIQLNRLDWRSFLKRPNPVAAALMSKMDIAKKDRPRVKLECLRMIANVEPTPAGRQLLSAIVDSYLPLNATETREFEARLTTEGLAEKEEIMEIVTSWMRQGIRQGRQEGRQEGAAEIALRLLRRRLGNVPAAQEARIRALRMETIAALGDAALDFTSETDLEEWLARES